MISQERLAMQGAAAVLTKELSRLKLQAKGHAANIRGQVSIYAMQHLNEIDIDAFETSAKLFVSNLKELHLRQAELAEFEDEL